MTNIVTHRRINGGLTVFVVLLGVYIVTSPYLPAITYWWTNRSTPEPPAYASAALQGEQPNTLPPTDNRLIIPSIHLDEDVLTDPSESTVNKGVWHRPLTATPDKLGNTVLVGHRFTYSAQVRDPFYHLDKVAIGDPIVLYWRKQPYTYSVKSIEIVSPDAVEVESQNIGDRLTLYTCTPLWSSANRLVIVAERQDAQYE